MPDMYGKAIIGLLIAAVLGFVGYEIYQAGYHASEVVYAKKIADDAKTTADLLKAAEDKVRDAEAAASARQTTLVADYEKQLKDVRDEKADAVARITAGTLRLSIPRGSANPVCAVPSPASPGLGGDATTRIDLPPALSNALVALASDADETVKQLSACQELVRQDRIK